MDPAFAITTWPVHKADPVEGFIVSTTIPPSPQPGTAGPVSAHGLPLASFAQRAIGALVDYVGPGLAALLIGSLFSGGSAYWIVSTLLNLATLAFFIWNTVLNGGNTGVTIGRGIAKTRLVSATTGQPIGPGMTFVRYLAHVVDSAICMIGYLFPLWDAQRQTIADKLLGTVVVDTTNARSA